MAELLTFFGVSLTIPAIANGAYKSFASAYEIYNTVETRRAQMELLLKRCLQIFDKLGRPSTQGRTSAPNVKKGIEQLHK